MTKRLAIWSPVSYLNFGDNLVRHLMVKHLALRLGDDYAFYPTDNPGVVARCGGLLVGGGSLLRHRFISAELLEAARGKPVWVYAGITSDSDVGEEGRRRTRRLLEMARQVWVRWPCEVAMLEGETSSPVAPGSDIAFLPFEYPIEAAQRYGGYSVVGWSHWHWSHEALHGAFVEAVRRLPEPRVFLAAEPMDCVFYGMLKERGIAIEFECGTRDWRRRAAILASAKRLFSMRFHYLVVATCHGVPVCPVYWPSGGKVRWLMDALWPEREWAAFPNSPMEFLSPPVEAIEAERHNAWRALHSLAHDMRKAL